MVCAPTPFGFRAPTPLHDVVAWRLHYSEGRSKVCPAGRFSDVQASSCSYCTAGYYCPLAGTAASAQLPCGSPAVRWRWRRLSSVWLAHSARAVWCLWPCACRCIARWDPSPLLRWLTAWLLLEARPRHARGSSGVAEATTASAENGSCGLLAWWQPRVSRTASASRVHVASTAVTSSVCFHAHATAPQGSYRRLQLCRGASYA